MANVSLKPAVIRLGHFDPDTQVLVEKGGDRFVMSLEEAIDACLSREEAKQMIARRELFERQMRLLVDRLRQWVEKNKHDVADAYFQIRPECQMFLVVLRKVEHDDRIEQELTDLTIEVSDDPAFSMARLDVQALPNGPVDDVRSFVDLDR
jgi:hypothetical protein